MTRDPGSRSVFGDLLEEALLKIAHDSSGDVLLSGIVRYESHRTNRGRDARRVATDHALEERRDALLHVWGQHADRAEVDEDDRAVGTDENISWMRIGLYWRTAPVPSQLLAA